MIGATESFRRIFALAGPWATSRRAFKSPNPCPTKEILIHGTKKTSACQEDICSSPEEGEEKGAKNSSEAVSISPLSG